MQNDEENEFFLQLFKNVFEKFRNPHDVPAENIVTSIQNFVDHCAIKKSPAGVCADIRFQSPADYLGYFYWHSPLSAAVTRNKVLDAIQNCEIFQSCFNRNSVNVVSVGGGPGCDLVGLYSAVSGCTYQQMNISLIENIGEWQPYFQAIHELLGNSHLFQNKTINVEFITHDMLSKQPGQLTTLKLALKKATLVWMKGFLATLANNDERHIVTQSIILSMPEGALLVVMESPSYDQFDGFVNGNILRRVYTTYIPPPPSQSPEKFVLKLDTVPDYRIQKETNQQIFIFQKC